MLNYILFYVLCSLVSFSILRLVFGSAIFSGYRDLLESMFNDAVINKRRFIYYGLYMLRCWQCFGYWCSMLVTAFVSICFQFLPLTLYGLGQGIVVALAVSVTTDVAAEYIPLTVASFDDFKQESDNEKEDE